MDISKFNVPIIEQWVAPYDNEPILQPIILQGQRCRIINEEEKEMDIIIETTEWTGDIWTNPTENNPVVYEIVITGRAVFPQ